MKNLNLIFSCLVCASTSLLAQTNLGSVDVGGNSTTTVTATIINPGTLNNITVSTAGVKNLDFADAGGGTCATGIPYAANATCTVEVTFAPTSVGARYGAILLTNQDGSIATTKYLQGAGNGPVTSFLPASAFVILNGFQSPTALATDSAGGVYAAEGFFNPIHDAQPSPGYITSTVGFYGSGASFPPDPRGVQADGAGNVYVAGGEIYIRQSSGTYALSSIFQNASAIDGGGNLYRGCTAGVCKETRQTDGTYVESTVASGLTPSGIAVDGNGNVFVASTNIYKFTPSASSYTQSTIYAGYQAMKVAADGMGNVYFIDANGIVYKETPQPDGSYAQTTIASGSVLAGIAADSKGNPYFFIPTVQNQFVNFYGVVKENSSAPPTLTYANTAQGSSTSPQVVTITNSGNSPLQFSEVTYPVDFPESSTGVADCTAATTLAPNATCTLTIKFAPVSSLNGNSSAILSESVTITTNTQNAPSTQQSVAVTGTETPGPAATPIFSLPAGVYYTTQSVTLSDTTPGAKIYYTLNGSTPTTSSTVAKGPIAIKSAETLKTIAIAPGYTNSQVVSAYYALTAPTPVISPAGDTFTGPQTVTITTATPIEAIFYSTADNLPTTSSARYTGPITVSATKNVIAFAAQTGFISSPMVRQRYVITAPAASATK